MTRAAPSIAAPAPARTVRLWTIQPELVWQRLREQGTLRVDPEQVCGHAGYLWLRDQLTRRIPGYGGGYPWWSYASRPDLRWHRHLRGLGGRYVRIELEKPAGQVLCFLAWAWDTIFDVEYLSASPTEARRWGRRMRRSVPDEDAWPLPEPWQSELVASWERLFDPRLPLRPELRGRGWTEDVEAVFETLDLADVRAVTPFVGARRY